MNEELRRRSLSRAVKIESSTHDVEESLEDPNGPGASEAQEPANDTANDEIDINIDDEVEQVDGASLEFQKDGEIDDQTQAIQDDQGKVDDYYTGFDDEPAEEDQTYPFEDDFDDGQNFEGEAQNLEANSDGLKVVTSTVTEVASLESNETSPHEEISAESVTVSADTVDVDEIDYEDDDLPPISVDTSNPHQSHNSGKVEDIDEIDYDDDDDDDEGAGTPESAQPEPLQRTSSSTPGKRQRSDSMSEAALGEGNQGKSLKAPISIDLIWPFTEAKRVRSWNWYTTSHIGQQFLSRYPSPSHGLLDIIFDLAICTLFFEETDSIPHWFVFDTGITRQRHENPWCLLIIRDAFDFQRLLEYR